MTTDNMQKKCSFCGESIPARAGRCPYCGSILEVTVDSTCSIGSNEVPPTDDGAQNPGDQVPPVQTPADQLNAGSRYNGDSGNTTQPVSYSGMQPNETEQMHNAYRSYGNGSFRQNYNYSAGHREPLSNGMKVFLSVVAALIPGFGQLAGIIAAIVFMNAEGDSDRKSFGVALLVASLILFVLSCIGCFVLVLASNQMTNFKY